LKIRNVLSTKGKAVITIRPEQSIKELVGVLAQHKIGALPVLDAAGRLVGIISERDVIREAAHNQALFDLPVSRLMTTDVVVGQPRDDVRAVLNTMTQRRFRHMPIVEQDQLVGIVSLGDLVKAQLDESQGTVDTLETQIIDGQG
jgi:CBS domain-containing protein